MQTYDPARRSPYQSAIPAMRHAPERAGSHSATPIYDALYAEYRMTFRTLPGDRSGEEELRFKSFAALAGFTDCTGFVTGLHGLDPLQSRGHLPAGGPLPAGERVAGGGHLQAGIPHPYGPHQGGGFHPSGVGFPAPRHEPRQLPPGPSHTGPPAHSGYQTHPGSPAPAPSAHAPHTAPGLPHPAHSVTAHPHPHQADQSGGHQPGIWRPVRMQLGPEALLPVVLPTRPPGEGTHP